MKEYTRILKEKSFNHKPICITIRIACSNSPYILLLIKEEKQYIQESELRLSVRNTVSSA